jgi:hypothetical protein
VNQAAIGGRLGHLQSDRAGPSYGGSHLLRAYRAHPDYGRLPLVLTAVAPPHDLAGTWPTELVGTFTDPAAVLAAVNRLLQPPATRQSHLPLTRRHASVGRWTSRMIGPQRTGEAVRPLCLEPQGVLGAAGRRRPTGSSALLHTWCARDWRSGSELAGQRLAARERPAGQRASVWTWSG